MKLAGIDATTGQPFVLCSQCSGDCCNRCDRETVFGQYCGACAKAKNWPDGPSAEQAWRDFVSSDNRKRGIE